MIILNRMHEQHTLRQSLLAFNQSPALQINIEPGPTRTRAGQVMTRTHQRLIDLAINSLQDDEDRDSSPSDLETDNDDQKV
jgi:hypothetical protein